MPLLLGIQTREYRHLEGYLFPLNSQHSKTTRRTDFIIDGMVVYLEEACLSLSWETTIRPIQASLRRKGTQRGLPRSLESESYENSGISFSSLIFISSCGSALEFSFDKRSLYLFEACGTFHPLRFVASGPEATGIVNGSWLQIHGENIWLAHFSSVVHSGATSEVQGNRIKKPHDPGPTAKEDLVIRERANIRKDVCVLSKFRYQSQAEGPGD